MKKTKFMRAALLLLVLTLITSCFVGGTFAKYTTSASGTDTARVARWGFKSTTILLDNLFSKNYAYADTSTPGNSVSGSVDVIAPGTKGEAKFGFTYDGGVDGIAAPEVAYTFTVNPTITGDYDSLDANDSFKWTLKKGDETATEYNTVADLLAAIKDLSGDASGTKTYNPGELPVAFTAADEVYTIGWKWAFEGNDTADTADTALGNSQTLENVTFSITITATQVD